MNKSHVFLIPILLSCNLGPTFKLCNGQTATQSRTITAGYDTAVLKTLANELKVKQTARLQEAQRAGFRVRYEQEKDNGLTVYAALQAVTSDGHPVYYRTFNADAASSTRTKYLHPSGQLGLGLTGEDMIVYVWDGGSIRPTHVEFGGRASIGDVDGGYNGAGSDHATHVTGTLIAAGLAPEAQGMAFKAHAKTYDWDFDRSEAVVQAAAGMLISNHSYGFAVRDRQDQPALPASYFGGYIDVAREWDRVMHNAPNYLMVVAAGNDGLDHTANSNPNQEMREFDKLTGHCVSKNSLVVANARDVSVGSTGEVLGLVQIVPSSSQGPTDDLRIKPDITGNGEELFSTLHLGHQGSTNDKYGQQFWTGTSMAAPNVAGSLLLLQELAMRETNSFIRSATLKGLALHSADDAGEDGPDVVFGWGLMNAKRAAETIIQNGESSVILEKTLNEGASFSLSFKAQGNVKASISWTDPPGVAISDQVVNSSSPVLVNDLDLRLSRGDQELLPWRLDSVNSNSKGDNLVDPYEQIHDNETFDSLVTYKIVVSHKGQLVSGKQDYTLILTGDSVEVESPDVTLSPIRGSSDIASIRFDLKRTISELSDILERLEDTATPPIEIEQVSAVFGENAWRNRTLEELLEERGKVGVFNLIKAADTRVPFSAEERKQLDTLLERMKMQELDKQLREPRPPFSIKPGIGTPDGDQ
ncbi:MAG: S8 family serine peptidase [Lacipirellulaceae bacterium]